jgi:hypothetical protein
MSIHLYATTQESILTPKGPRVFFAQIASKQPLLKASRIVQN